MKKIFYIMIMAVLFIASCDYSDKKEAEANMDELSMDAQNELNEFEMEMRKFGNEIDNEIAELDSKMENAGDEMKVDLEERKRELQSMKIKLQKNIDEAERNAKDNWESFKTSTNEFFTEIKNSLDDDIEVEEIEVEG